jgi:hypothetical protein
MGFSCFGINAIQKFEDRVAMPGISVKGAAYLVGETCSFGHTVLLGFMFFSIETL